MHAPVAGYDELLADPHVTAVDALPAVEHDGTGTVPMANVPGLPPIEAGVANAHAPHLGEHTRATLTEAGYDAGAMVNSPCAGGTTARSIGGSSCGTQS